MFHFRATLERAFQEGNFGLVASCGARVRDRRPARSRPTRRRARPARDYAGRRRLDLCRLLQPQAEPRRDGERGEGDSAGGCGGARLRRHRRARGRVLGPAVAGLPAAERRGDDCGRDRAAHVPGEGQGAAARFRPARARTCATFATSCPRRRRLLQRRPEASRVQAEFRAAASACGAPGASASWPATLGSAPRRPGGSRPGVVAVRFRSGATPTRRRLGLLNIQARPCARAQDNQGVPETRATVAGRARPARRDVQTPFPRLRRKRPADGAGT
jgi:hypothetical protein